MGYQEGTQEANYSHQKCYENRIFSGAKLSTILKSRSSQSSDKSNRRNIISSKNIFIVNASGLLHKTLNNVVRNLFLIFAVDLFTHLFCIKIWMQMRRLSKLTCLCLIQKLFFLLSTFTFSLIQYCSYTLWF